MATVPLNFFVRASSQLKTTYTQVYSAPTDTAAIMLTILATNITSTPQSIVVGISGNGEPGGNIPTRPYFDIVKNVQVPANDVLNVAIGKIVLDNYDGLYCYAGANSAINITCSVLETYNALD